jgi:hypothetical protein
MVRNKFRLSVTVAVALLTFGDVASAIPIPAPIASIGVSPTLVRAGAGGAWTEG